MTTKFKVDLNTNTFEFGALAKGQMTNLFANINLSSSQGTMPYYGEITGDFIGEIKGANVIPTVIKHVSSQEVNSGVNIIIVGAGGTGGYLIRDLTRFIYALKQKGDTRQFLITIIDPDKVESKNILRQNFTPRDEGQYKAEVMAKRYSNAFGLEIHTILEFATRNILSQIINSTRNSNGNMTPTIIVGCVDNNAARRVIKAAIRDNSAVYWIDSGNESKSGQVVIGFDRSRHYGTYNAPTDGGFFAIPHVTDLYPEIEDESNDPVEETKISCAERAVIDTQNIFINMIAASHILTFMRQVITREPITINAIEFNIKGITTPRYITEGTLKEIFSKPSSRY